MGNTKNIRFKDLCTQHTEILSNLLSQDYKLYERWLDFIVNEYNDVSKTESAVERLENSTIISLIAEAVDCLDGIAILHNKCAINAAYPLIRKLMELNFQLQFILQSDTENKALAYEAYYVSRKTKGLDDKRNIYLKYKKYNDYKKEADSVFKDDNPVFREWYGIYDLVEKQPCSKNQEKKLIKTIKSLCDEIGDKKIYDNIYNLISKNVHGIFARDRIRLDVLRQKNYLCDYREPEGITYQTRCCNVMIVEIYKSFCKHYSRNIDYNFLSEQFDLINEISLLEKQYSEKSSRKDI